MNTFRLTTRPISRSYRAFTQSSLPRVVRCFSTQGSYDNILIEDSERPGVTLIRLNRPKALNALSSDLFKELNDALKKCEEDPEVGAIVLTGSDKAFAAGADIKEMAPLTFSDAYANNFIASWSFMSTLRTPVIAAVSGHALGGGCELAMMCDIIYATKTANFGQPEIKLGTIPGAGGSQRLTRAIGKSKAMELILTGNNYSGEQAEKDGLVAKAVDGGNKEVVDLALATAGKIASYSRIAVVAAKEVVNKSQDLGIREGVEYERRIFHALFGSQDQKVGMKAFAEKQKPQWTHS